ncbi:flavin reductase family protein [Pseudogemmobacter faecipullorum]|uniref:Flavin reductase family protein n=1 Tax=Pseudogemmobacter faecipullorum TaxID=2755041 RepID=A0ABS8CPV6_9RHOB|nr:flavin reductase family protein [Pseudogemmobacter faecipullorum]MCB5411423.1 flavin reductase family protein [Pseudogemmobacter faecipullorum]
MYFDFSALGEGIAYKLMTACVTPRPIAWVVSQSEAGEINAAPFSFFNLLGDAPPTLVLGLTGKADGTLKHSARNILATRDFVVNLVPAALLDAMNLTAIDAPDGVNELELAGLSPAPSTRIAPPRIAASPVAFECRLAHAVETGPGQYALIATILAMHIADSVVLDAARGHIDAPALDLIARSFGPEYLRPGERLQRERPRWQNHPAAAPSSQPQNHAKGGAEQG